MLSGLNRNPRLIAFIWAVFIAVLCAIPGKDLPSANWLELLSADKFIHAFLFYFQFYFTHKAFINHPKLKNKAILFFLCAAYGALLEILQGAVFVDRTADLYDFIANSGGAALAALLSFRKELKKP